MAIGLGVKAVEAGYSMLFLTLEGLMTRLVRAKHENRLERALQQLSYPKVLDTGRTGLPAANTRGGKSVLSGGGPPVRTGKPDCDEQ